MPEIDCSQAGTLTVRCVQSPLVGLQALQIREARLRSLLLGAHAQRKEGALSELLSDTTSYTGSSDPNSLKPAKQRD